jgi:hypothetical protein
MALIPPDRARCQADVPTGHSFLSMGPGPKHVRCETSPHVIVEERRPGEDGHAGSMSLCLECLAVMSRQASGEIWQGVFIKEVI